MVEITRYMIKAIQSDTLSKEKWIDDRRKNNRDSRWFQYGIYQ